MLMFEEDFGAWDRLKLWWTGQQLTTKEKEYLSMIVQSLSSPIAQQLLPALDCHLISVHRKDQFTNPRRISTLILTFDDKCWAEKSIKVRLDGGVVAQVSFDSEGDLVPFRIITHPIKNSSRWSLEVRLYYTFARMMDRYFVK